MTVVLVPTKVDHIDVVDAFVCHALHIAGKIYGTLFCCQLLVSGFHLQMLAFIYKGKGVAISRVVVKHDDRGRSCPPLVYW